MTSSIKGVLGLRGDDEEKKECFSHAFWSVWRGGVGFFYAGRFFLSIFLSKGVVSCPLGRVLFLLSLVTTAQGDANGPNGERAVGLRPRHKETCPPRCDGRGRWPHNREMKRTIQRSSLDPARKKSALYFPLDIAMQLGPRQRRTKFTATTFRAVSA